MRSEKGDRRREKGEEVLLLSPFSLLLSHH
jgi:hypothetical protein